jgi:hypothetical protein
MPNNDFLISESNGSWNLRATKGRIVRQVALMLYGAAAVLVLGVCMDYFRKSRIGQFWDIPGTSYFFTVVGCLVAIIFSGCGIWIWRIRNVQLSINTKSGEVHFGKQLLCSEGTVQSVVLKCPSRIPEDEDNYFIEFKLKDQTFVEIPTPVFVALGNFENASALAAEMAAKLNVDVAYDD